AARFGAGPGSPTLPMVIFSSVKFGISPQINALATLMMVVVATGIFIASLVMARQDRQRKRDEQMAVQGG
ncbi:putrescine ABC transporter permease PotI, partial [Azospirillum brasilense]|nr:putrescine ABC transporter permease PotI [Azospirillum brasilense]